MLVSGNGRAQSWLELKGHRIAAITSISDLRDVALRPVSPAPGATTEVRFDRLRPVSYTHLDVYKRQVDDRELHRAGPSWTIDTLVDLRREIGDAAPLAILIGADSFLGLPTWRSWQSLTDFAHIVIAERPGSRIDQHALPEPLHSFAAPRWCTSAMALHLSLIHI